MELVFDSLLVLVADSTHSPIVAPTSSSPQSTSLLLLLVLFLGICKSQNVSERQAVFLPIIATTGLPNEIMALRLRRFLQQPQADDSSDNDNNTNDEGDDDDCTWNTNNSHLPFKEIHASKAASPFAAPPLQGHQVFQGCEDEEAESRKAERRGCCHTPRPVQW